MRYFYCPPTCTLAGMAALEITGAAYEPVLVEPAGDRAELLAANPLGKVPALDLGSVVVTDTVAIIYWLARAFPQAGLLDGDETRTALALSRMAWFGNALQIVRRRVTRPMMFSPEPQAQESIRRAARGEYEAGLRQVDAWMGEPDCPLAVRVYALLFFHWALMDGMDVSDLTRFAAAVDRLAARPDVGRALVLHRSPLGASGDLTSEPSAGRPLGS